MKKLFLILILMLSACQGIVPPESFVYQEIQTVSYRLASWQKIEDKKSPIRIYIEGDGYAFNRLGLPTNNPTPHSDFLRKIAFNDPNKNVIYLGRVCQYVKDERCSQKDWTTGRFSKEIIEATAQAIQKISAKQPVILIGYSGGALISGLVIQQDPKLPVQKWITIAGVLNHTKWTKDLSLPALTDSVDLEKLPNVKQQHFVGDKDKIVSWRLTKSLVADADLLLVPGATHDSGFDEYVPLIYR